MKNLRRGLIAVSALAFCLSILVTTSASAEPLRKFSLQQLAKIVKEEGYGKVSVHDDHLRFKADGRTFALYLYDNGDLQMYYGITGVVLNHGDVNKWNRDYRLSRAYTDDDGDPVLEADLLANAGMTEKIITEFIKVFVDSSTRYRSFVLKHDRSEDGAPPAAPPASPRT
jgi:hypothetical protein